MCENKKLELAAATKGVRFYVLDSGNGNERHFGVMAEAESDSSCTASVENIFFTGDEATKCCEWLAENEVEPIILREVLDNFYRI